MLNTLQAADWTFPVPIRYGPGRIAELAEVCRAAGSGRPLVVTDRGSAGLPFVSAALESLKSAGLGAELYAHRDFDALVTASALTIVGAYLLIRLFVRVKL